MGTTHSRQARAAAAANDVAALQQIASAHPLALLRQSCWKQRSALHLAARAGASEALAAVLDVAAHRQPSCLLTEVLNAPDYCGDTALALACKHGYTDCVRELLAAGANPLPANLHGVTSLHHAAQGGYAACMHLLLKTLVRLPDGSRCPAGQAPVSDFVDMDKFIDTRAHSGLCALHLAVLSGSHLAVSELVNHGAQLDTPLLTVAFRTPNLVPPCLGAGSTALHMAAATGRLPLCVLLLHAQQQRHPGLELRRLRNSRGMTPLNVALCCNHANLASLLTAGAPVPAPPAPPRGRSSSGQLPPLLRQQLLALVHRAALLGQLRELGLGAAAAAAAPPLPGLATGPIRRLEALLHSDAATAQQVLAIVDEMLDDAAAGGAASGRGSSGSPPRERGRDAGGQAGGARSSSSSRRRARRRQEREAAAVGQLAVAQAGVDWTLLERNRSLWHAEHGGTSLYRRLHRRHERPRQAHPVGPAPSAIQGGSQRREQAGLTYAGAMPPIVTDRAQQQQQHYQQQQQQNQQAGPSGSGPGSISMPSGSSSSSSSVDLAAAVPPAISTAAAAPAAAGGEQQQPVAGQSHHLVAASHAEGGVCPVCLDLPAGIALAPCGHCACLACCGRLAAYCASSSSSSFGLPASGPLCPLCRAPIECFVKPTASS